MPTMCLGARGTTLRKGMMSENSAHLCADYDNGFFSNMSEFHKHSLRIFYRYFNIEANHDNVQRTYILLAYIFIVPTGEQFAIGKMLPKRSGGVPFGCHAEIHKRLLIGQMRYRAGSRRRKLPIVNGLLECILRGYEVGRDKKERTTTAGKIAKKVQEGG